MIDDFGLTPLAEETVRDLLEIFDDRYDRRSTLITSQLPVDQWHTYLSDRTVADAILDIDQRLLQLIVLSALADVVKSPLKAAKRLVFPRDAPQHRVPRYCGVAQQVLECLTRQPTAPIAAKTCAEQ